MGVLTGYETPFIALVPVVAATTDREDVGVEEIAQIGSARCRPCRGARGSGLCTATATFVRPPRPRVRLATFRV